MSSYVNLLDRLNKKRYDSYMISIMAEKAKEICLLNKLAFITETVDGWSTKQS